MVKTINKIITYMFIFIELFLYAVFLYLDVKQIDSTMIKYSCIIICFLYSFFEIKNWSIEKITARVIALLTVICDLFLLVLNKNYNLGTTIFLFVQIGYFFVLYFFMTKKHFKISLFIRLGLSIFIGIIVFIIEKDILYVISTIYFLMEIINFFDAISIYIIKKDKSGFIFIIGMFMFICCDICVGLNNIVDYNRFIQYGMWLFYLPSQVLLVLFTTKGYKNLLNN